MKLDLYSLKGEKVGTHEISDAIFNAPANAALVHDVVTAYAANARQVLAHTKGRGDVNGGGKKPWKQKGTGRARHGSIRSPIWKGGGVTFGPLSERNYSQKINKKTKTLAVRMCLSDKLAEGKMVVVAEFPTTGKTKDFSALRSKVLTDRRTLLVLTAGKDEVTMKSAGNLDKVDVMRASDVTVVDLMHHTAVIMSQAAATALEKRLK